MQYVSIVTFLIPDCDYFLSYVGFYVFTTLRFVRSILATIRVIFDRVGKRSLQLNSYCFACILFQWIKTHLFTISLKNLF